MTDSPTPRVNPWRHPRQWRWYQWLFVSSFAFLFIVILATSFSGNSSHASKASNAPVKLPPGRRADGSYKNRPVVPASDYNADAIKAWAPRVTDFSNAMQDAAPSIADAAESPDVTTQGSDAWLKMASGLAAFETCRSQFEATDPPAGAPGVGAIRSACREYAAGAKTTARGIDALDAATITQGAARIALGSHYIERATAAISDWGSMH
jgi:hypothetical protein